MDSKNNSLREKVIDSRFRLVDLGRHQDEIEEITELENVDSWHVMYEKEGDYVIQEKSGEVGFVRSIAQEDFHELMNKNWLKFKED